jgi:hypothetical protein
MAGCRSAADLGDTRSMTIDCTGTTTSRRFIARWLHAGWKGGDDMPGAASLHREPSMVRLMLFVGFRWRRSGDGS